MLTRVKDVYHSFPRTFWTLIGATFIDRLGGALLFPFFALYITARFGVGMTEVGYLFAIFAVSSVTGGLIAGALTDRFGRRWMLLFGLVASGLSILIMGLVAELSLFYGATVLVGLLSNTGGPAQQAMVADLLPQEKRAEGYGILRVVANLAVTIGPAIGGFIATRSYLGIFILDAFSSLLTAGIVYLVLPETRPEAAPDEPESTLWQTVRGYAFVLRDRLYLIFIAICILTLIVYFQMNSTLSVYLHDVHGVTEQRFGWMFSFSAGMVVLFQFSVTRRIKQQPPFLMLLLGALLFAIGFGLYGVVAAYPLFLLAIAIITLGEMVFVPISQALVARFAPADMRGRYMAFFSFAWMIPNATGPLAAGLIMDNLNPDLVWLAAAVLATVAAAGYGVLHFYSRGNVRLAATAPAGQPAAR